MKQRADARAAQFLGPKFSQIIEWKQNSHVPSDRESNA
jgi:hypothetical protein